MNDTISRVVDLTREQEEYVRPGGGRTGVVPEHTAELFRAVGWDPRRMERARLLSPATSQPVIDCYSLLRTRILHRVAQGNYASLGVTSPAPRDGKSLTAANLALSLTASETRAVVLIDADVRRPSLSALFGIPVRLGLGDCLAGDATLEDVILRLPQTGLFFIPGRVESRLRPQALSAEKVQDFIRRLRRLLPQALLLFDLPPVLVGGDVMVFAPSLDGTLLVVANRRTREADMQQAMTLLDGVNLLGTVLNYAEETLSRNEYYGGK